MKNKYKKSMQQAASSRFFLHTVPYGRSRHVSGDLPAASFNAPCSADPGQERIYALAGTVLLRCSSARPHPRAIALAVTAGWSDAVAGLGASASVLP